MVDELVQLVEGGSRTGVSAGAAAPRPAPVRPAAAPANRQGPSRSAPIAGNAAPASRKNENIKMVSAADVIPLDEDDDF